MVSRILGAILIVLGLGLGGLAAVDARVLDAACDDEERVAIASMTDSQEGYDVFGPSDTASILHTRPPDQVRRDAKLVVRVGRTLAQDAVLLPHMRAYTWRSLRGDVRELEERKLTSEPVAPGDALAIRALQQGADEVDYALEYGGRTLVAAFAQALFFFAAGLMALATRWGRAASLLVMATSGPYFYLNLFDGYVFVPLLLGVVLAVASPSLGLADWVLQRFFPPTATPRDAYKRMLVVGVGMVVFSAALSGVSFLVAEALGAGSFAIASGGILYGLALIGAGARGLASG